MKTKSRPAVRSKSPATRSKSPAARSKSPVAADHEYAPKKYVLEPAETAVCQFYKKKYVEAISLSRPDLEKKIKAAPADHWKYGYPIRYNTFKSMGTNLFMDITDTIVVVYKIKDISVDEREVIYNITYINIQPPNKQKDLFFDNDAESKIIADVSQHGHLYINNMCPVSSTVSKDGEYRSVLIYWKMIQYFLEHHKGLSALFDDIKKYFVDKFQHRKFLIYSHYYFPTDELRNKYSFELELMIANKKIEFFSITWFLFYHVYTYGTISDHTNIIFQKIMLKHKLEDAEFFKSLVAKHSLETVRYLYHLCNTNIRSTKDRGIEPFCKVKLGQKFIPISLREIQCLFDLGQKPWKEYFVCLRLSDLVINGNTPGYPITTNYFLVKNTDKHLFDNPSQYTRMEKSADAAKISNILNQARFLAKEQIKPSHIMTYDEDSTFAQKMNVKNKNMITSWLSREFQMLHDYVDQAIIHSHSNIIMSNVTFCIVSEYVGKTLYESIFITKKSSYYKQLVSNMFSEKGYPQFERIMFELMYNLHCASSKLGIIHGDLHMHNITLNDLFYKSVVEVEVANPKVLYRVGADQEYIFDTNFYYMTLIDYSRCIIDPAKANMFRNDPIHKTFDLIENMKEFEEQQCLALTNYLFSCKPEYKEYGVPLQNGIRMHFSIFFKIFTVLDMYMISGRLLDFFQFKKQQSLVPYSAVLTLIKSINSACDLYITSSLDALMKIPELDAESRQADEWPLVALMKQIFGHKNIQNVKNINADDIVDIYNYDNDVEYSLNKVENLPPPFKDLENLGGDRFIKNSVRRRRYYDSQTESNFKTLLVIKKRQREKNIL